MFPGCITDMCYRQRENLPKWRLVSNHIIQASCQCGAGTEKTSGNEGMPQKTQGETAACVELGDIPGAQLQALELGNVQELSSSDAGL